MEITMSRTWIRAVAVSFIALAALSSTDALAAKGNDKGNAFGIIKGNLLGSGGGKCSSTCRKRPGRPASRPGSSPRTPAGCPPSRGPAAGACAAMERRLLAGSVEPEDHPVSFKDQFRIQHGVLFIPYMEDAFRHAGPFSLRELFPYSLYPAPVTPEKDAEPLLGEAQNGDPVLSATTFKFLRRQVAKRADRYAVAVEIDVHPVPVPFQSVLGRVQYRFHAMAGKGDPRSRRLENPVICDHRRSREGETEPSVPAAARFDPEQAARVGENAGHVGGNEFRGRPVGEAPAQDSDHRVRV